jgi:AAA+ ATPase superfamily predicted ATPase
MVGREKEIELLSKIYSSDKPELLAVFGRRRVGKTFLIRSFFKGKIDEIGIWDRVLSESEILNLYEESLGITYDRNENFFITYPNPSSDYLTIVTANSLNNSFYLFDYMGKEVLQGRIKDNSTNLNISNLFSGIYTLKIEGYSKIQRIVKN